MAGGTDVFKGQARAAGAPPIEVFEIQVAAAGAGTEYIHRQGHGSDAAARQIQLPRRDAGPTKVGTRGQVNRAHRAHADVAAGGNGAAHTVSQTRNEGGRKNAPQFNPATRAQCNIAATTVNAAARTLQNVAPSGQSDCAAVASQGTLPGTQVGVQQQVTGGTGGAQPDAARTGLYAPAVVERGLAAHSQSAHYSDKHATHCTRAQATLRQGPQRRGEAGFDHALEAQVSHSADLQRAQGLESDITRQRMGRDAVYG